MFNKILWLCLSLLSTLAWANQDPTKPLNAGFANSSPVATQSKLVLQSIMHDADNYRAVINGKLVKRGDFILGYKVINIASNSVFLVSAEQELQLPLFSGAVIK